jgi:transglutaminase-like putative cysteine protease
VRCRVAAILLALSLAGFAVAEPPASREFLLRYEAAIAGQKPGQAVRVWLPVPSANEDQAVEIVRRELPAEGKIDREPKYGNRVLYVEAPADADGRVTLAMTYRVKRREVRGASAEKLTDEQREQFLKPDALVPIGGKPTTLLEGKKVPEDQTRAARLFYDVVNAHLKYSKEGTGWGRGDAEWACDSRFGNCSDFHSLFISLARTHRIPAKFEIGFPIPAKRGQGDIAGYHCWAKFSPDGQTWVPVDISEANKDPKLTDYYFGNLTADRVALSVGRDLTLVPRQDGPPLNFFVEPYAESAGKPIPAANIKRKAGYEDVK